MGRLGLYFRDSRGATAVEFAIVSLPFIITLLFVLSVGALIYVNQAVDYATARATRRIATGAAQGASLSKADFRSDLCGNLPATIKCDDVIVNLYLVNKAVGPGGYYTFVKSDTSGLLIPDLTPGSGQYNIGKAGDYQYLQVIYPITMLPAFLTSILGSQATYNGSPAYLAISTATFRNEQF